MRNRDTCPPPPKFFRLMQHLSLSNSAGLLTRLEIRSGDEAEDVDYLLVHKKIHLGRPS